MLSTHSPKHTQPRALLIHVVRFFILSPKHKHSRLKYIVVSACCITELKLFVNFEHNRCFLHLHKLPAFEKKIIQCAFGALRLPPSNIYSVLQVLEINTVP